MSIKNPVAGTLKITLSSATVTTAGTRVQIATDTDLRYSAIKILNPYTNTGIIYVGDSTVSSTVYDDALFPGDAIVYQALPTNIGPKVYKPSLFYIDSNTSGTAVRITYEDEV